MAEWQSIESAPKDGRIFLAWHLESQSVQFMAWVDRDGFRVAMPKIRGFNYAIAGNWGACQPTHWMPLPDPPTVPTHEA